MFVLESLCLLLRSLREFSVDILLHDKSADRYTVGGTPSTVLDVDGDGNLRFVHRGKTHEDRVVVTAVLCRTRLATGYEIVA